jgi:hypothetical protein
MDCFEYKVIPAPRRSIRVKGAKGSEGKFAATFEKVINEQAIEGWQYLRAESLPVDERHGITMRKIETYQNVLIFQRVADLSEPENIATALIEDQSDDEETLELADEETSDVADADLTVSDSEDAAKDAIEADNATEVEVKETTVKQTKGKNVSKAKKPRKAKKT